MGSDEIASEEELQRRAEEARIRAILEPQEEEARARMRQLRQEAEEHHATEMEYRRTRRYAIFLLVALLATTILAAVRWLMLN